ncbi:MAG: GDP-mannose 4,6-dehydratase [Saezia sp.]
MILITGGAGYIGTHTCVALMDTAEPFIIIDNFSNSSRNALQRLEQICKFKPLCIEGDIRNVELLSSIFQKHPIDAVIHFAASKYVGESVAKPLEYYDRV